MRQTAARLNRAWLIILGLVTVISGAIITGLSTGLLARAAARLGLQVSTPALTAPVLPPGSAGSMSGRSVAVLAILGGTVLAVLAVLWLIAQIPRRNAAKPFRLQDTAQTGLTRCSPDVLIDAVRSEVEALPGVQSVSAVLRGSVRQPDLTMKVTADDRTDLAQLLQALQNRIAGDLASSLDTRLDRLGIQLEVDAAKTTPGQITVGPRPASAGGSPR